jgi:hypothetical protein
MVLKKYASGSKGESAMPLLACFLHSTATIAVPGACGGAPQPDWRGIGVEPQGVIEPLKGKVEILVQIRGNVPLNAESHGFQWIALKGTVGKI